MNTDMNQAKPLATPQSRPEMRVNSSTADPVLLVAPPCTFSWIICAMLGQHPQMYGLPELHLFSAETMAEWLDLCSRESYDMDQGLMRTVAEICFGGQSDYTIARARGWVKRRAHFTTGFLLEGLAQRLNPLIPIEKSPSIVYRIEFMQRAFSMFPQARFLHLVSHPRTYCESVMGAIRGLEELQPLPRSHWLRHLASFPHRDADDVSRTSVLDPQGGWYALNMNIVDFLKSVPDDQKRTVRGEELLASSDGSIREIIFWLGLRTDSEALEAMKHPERSPYACYGPSSAPFGSDIFVLEGPLLPSDWLEPRRLEGQLSWSPDGQEFSPEVKQLAGQFGYE
jgi:sulfotransferase family protein